MSAKHAIAILALGVLAGCGDAGAPGTQDEQERGETRYLTRGVSVFSDPENGCEYLIAWGSTPAGITPRLNPDGTQVCTQKDNGE